MTVEFLESRTVLSAININSGALAYLSNTAGLTVSTTGPGGTYTFADNQPFILFPGAISAGWTTSGNTATGPNDSVTSMTLTASGITDNITIQSVDANTTIGSIVPGATDTVNVLGKGLPGGITLTLNDPGNNTLNYDAGGLVPTVTAGAPGEVIISLPGFGTTDTNNYANINITDVGTNSVTPGPTTTINSVEGFRELDAIVGTFTAPPGPPGLRPRGERLHRVDRLGRPAAVRPGGRHDHAGREQPERLLHHRHTHVPGKRDVYRLQLGRLCRRHVHGRR